MYSITLKTQNFSTTATHPTGKQARYTSWWVRVQGETSWWNPVLKVLWLPISLYQYVSGEIFTEGVTYEAMAAWTDKLGRTRYSELVLFDENNPVVTVPVPRPPRRRPFVEYPIAEVRIKPVESLEDARIALEDVVEKVNNLVRAQNTDDETPP